MDPILNPYAPGAGTPPPELAGRDGIRERARIATERILKGRPARSLLMVGLRGVGKTVLLDKIRDSAESRGCYTLRIEAPEARSLPALLAPQLRLILLKLGRIEGAKALAERGLRALAGFAKALKFRYGDIEVGLDVEPEPGLADNGDLEQDLSTLLEALGKAAQKADTALVMFIDELQYVEEEQLAILISALHRCAQRQLPITLLGAGLPQLRARIGRAKSYAERLFEFPEVGALDEASAAAAIVRPAQQEGVALDPAAVAEIIRQTKGYPYFLQEWSKHAWDCADKSPITLADVNAASTIALAALDNNFFRVRFERLTPSDKHYLRAMADLGAGPHRSGDIADRLGRNVRSVAPTRNKLTKNGMIWSPSHGDTAFTVPLFDKFMQRIMPGRDWQDR